MAQTTKTAKTAKKSNPAKVAKASKPVKTAKPAKALKPAKAAKPAKATKPAKQKMPFKPGDFVVYPTHGVGKVVRIEIQEIAGHKLKLFVISFDRDRMTLRVPVSKATTSGLRKLSSRKKMDNAFLVDLDGDGDMDIATTEENGGWGVIWFENPSKK